MGDHAMTMKGIETETAIEKEIGTVIVMTDIVMIEGESPTGMNADVPALVNGDLPPHLVLCPQLSQLKRPLQKTRN
jgi:hypothetical protein